MLNPLQVIGKKILREKCVDVIFPDENLEKIIESLFAVMYRFSGVGLAANQVGISKRIAVIDCKMTQKKEDQIILINPEILETSGEQEMMEGCLSIPGFSHNLKRPLNVKVKTHNLDGSEKVIDCVGLEARAVLHESDHLDGKLFTDRMPSIDKLLVDGKLKKIARQFKRL